MTATIKPPNNRTDRPQSFRLSSMEVLGFSDASSTWSESPRAVVPEVVRRGRHETTVVDLQPEEFVDRLSGSNIRWGIVSIALLVVAGLAGLGFWLYQRPLAQEQESISAITEQAATLDAALSTLEQFNDGMLSESAAPTSDLAHVEGAARALFDSSGRLGETQTDIRTAASTASSSALDAVRLATEARSYRAAVLPLLLRPDLETDPTLIELDEAARNFGDWQLGFDQVRSALPEGALSVVTEQLDILSGDLAGVLGDYMDALREDDKAAAEAVLAALDQRLGSIAEGLDSAVEDIQTRIDGRIGDTRNALTQLIDT